MAEVNGIWRKMSCLLPESSRNPGLFATTEHAEHISSLQHHLAHNRCVRKARFTVRDCVSRPFAGDSQPPLFHSQAARLAVIDLMNLSWGVPSCWLRKLLRVQGPSRSSPREGLGFWGGRPGGPVCRAGRAAPAWGNCGAAGCRSYCRHGRSDRAGRSGRQTS